MKPIQDVIRLRNRLDDKTCVAFSGGVDSSLLARMIASLGFDLSLVSISFGDNNEIEYVMKAAEIIGGELYHSRILIDELEKGLLHTIKTVEYDRIALLENAVGYYFIFKHSSRNGFNSILSAHGIDELYCGYDIFRREYHNRDLNRLINELTETAKQDKYIIDRLAKLFDITYHCPFLDNEFIEYSKDVPLNQKIIDENDTLRKHHIRAQALKLGLPENIAYHVKSSFQYSSGLHRAIRLLARKNGYTNKKGKSLGYESGVMAYITMLKKELG